MVSIQRVCLLAAVAACAIPGVSASAAVVNDVPLGTSIGSTPSGDLFTARQQVTTPGNPTMPSFGAGYPGPVPAGYASFTTLNATAGLKVIKDWSTVPVRGDFSSSDSNHILNFTDPSVPDIRVTIIGYGGFNNGGGQLNGFDSTTTDTRLSLQGGSTGSVKFEFGSYVGTTFTPGTAVGAAGFDVAKSDFFNGVGVKFKDAAGVTLSDQFGGNPGNNNRSGETSYFFGSDVGGIASIEVTYSNDNNKVTGIDNLAFAPVAVPEPASAAVAAVAGLGLLARRRRS